MTDHWFWFTIAMMAIIWYSTITVYVAIRGSFDIRHMLETLKQSNGDGGAPSES